MIETLLTLTVGFMIGTLTTCYIDNKDKEKQKDEMWRLEDQLNAIEGILLDIEVEEDYFEALDKIKEVIRRQTK